MNDKKYFSVDEIKQKLERYCVYQDRCHKEIENKLQEYTESLDVKEHVILHLLEHNFLNEERFSKSFARGKFSIKKWGKQRITNELKLRDISDYNIKTALKEIDEDMYIKTIYDITEKRNAHTSEPDFYKRRKKLTDFLIRKGYEFDLIYKVIKEVLETK